MSNDSTDQTALIKKVANDLHRLNASVMQAVEGGVTVELMRVSRHHNEKGAWGDLLVPIIHQDKK